MKLYKIYVLIPCVIAPPVCCHRSKSILVIPRSWNMRARQVWYSISKLPEMAEDHDKVSLQNDCGREVSEYSSDFAAVFIRLCSFRGSAARVI